jgi:hypothetical protein
MGHVKGIEGTGAPEDGPRRKHKPTGLELHFVDPRLRDEPVYPQRPRSIGGAVAAERLSLWFTPDEPFEPAEFLTRVRAYGNAPFLPDSSFFDASIDQSVWTELLSRSRQIVLLSQVREELGGWLVKEPDHPAAAAISTGGLATADPTAWSTTTKTAFLYYVNLLGIRKRLYRAAEIQLEGELGRPPTPEEFTHAKREISRILGRHAATAGCFWCPTL